jgi:hypothetical protein
MEVLDSLCDKRQNWLQFRIVSISRKPFKFVRPIGVSVGPSRAKKVTDA